MSAPDPFATLGIAATSDMARVKQAYFAALAKHPPHSDPEGFRRLRQAYEALMRPGALRAAYLHAPLDLNAELAAYEDRLRRPAPAPAPPTAARFIDLCFGLDLPAAEKLFEPAGPTSP